MGCVLGGTSIKAAGWLGHALGIIAKRWSRPMVRRSRRAPPPAETWKQLSARAAHPLLWPLRAWRRPRRSPARPCRRRSEEHTSELQSLMRNSYAVFCLKKKRITKDQDHKVKKHKPNQAMKLVHNI